MTFPRSNTIIKKMLLLLRFLKVGTLDWARPFPADASSTSRANEGPALSALPWSMAYRPWALAELTRGRPFVGTRLDVSILLLLTNRHNKGILLHFCQQNGKK